MTLSSSAPNSPPMSVGSPTSMTSVVVTDPLPLEIGDGFLLAALSAELELLSLLLFSLAAVDALLLRRFGAGFWLPSARISQEIKVHFR